MISGHAPSDALAGKTVLVTGGAGFIGSHLVDALLRAGARVRVLDDFSSGRRENLAAVGDECELLVGDIRDESTCRSACRGVSIVFHQAAIASVTRSVERPGETMAVNVAGTACVLAAARDEAVDRVVYASSSAVYGDATERVASEGGEGRALSPYALSKAMGEELGAHFHDCFGVRSVGLRYFNVYGPRQDPHGPYAAVIPRFVEAAIAGRPAVIYGDGLQSRDFVAVADAVRANLLAATAPGVHGGRAYNVATGAPVTLLELVARIGERLDGWQPPVHEEARKGDIRHSLGDGNAALRSLGFAPSVSLAEGLAATLEWYRERARSASR